MTSVDLEKLNELNIETPGLVCVVLDTSGKPKYLYSVDEFDPKCHTLKISQIWNTEQEKIVRKKIDWLKDCNAYKDAFDTNSYVNPYLFKDLSSLQELLIDWLDSKEDLTAGGLSD